MPDTISAQSEMLLRWLTPKLCRTAIAGHNYDRWEVTPDGLTRYGVIEAVNQFCNQTRAALSFLTCEAQRSFAFKV